MTVFSRVGLHTGKIGSYGMVLRDVDARRGKRSVSRLFNVYSVRVSIKRRQKTEVVLNRF